MKNTLAAFLFCCYSTIVNANETATFETTKPVVCTSSEDLFKALNNSYKEIPVWLGSASSKDSRYSLFVNKKSGSWTFVQFDNQTACILGVGESSTNLKDPSAI